MSTFNPIFYYNIITSIPSFTNLLVAAYKFENNGNDSYIGGYNATNAGKFTFSSTNASNGLAGQSISNISSRLTIPDNNVFTFSNGTNDTPFSIKVNITTSNTTITRSIFHKWSGYNNNTSEYHLYTKLTTGRLAIDLFNKNPGGSRLSVETITSVTDGITKNIIVTYDGSGVWSGIKIYVNGVLQSLNNLSVGTYTCMGNTSLNTTIGGAATAFVGTIDELYIFNAELNTTQVAILQSNYYPNF